MACSTQQASTPPAKEPTASTTTLSPTSRHTSLSQALIQRGEVALARGDREEARKRFQRALEAAPDSAGAHTGLGKVYFLEGDFAAAIPTFQKAIALDPNLAEARLGLARCMREQGDTQSARAELEKAFTRNLRTPALQQEFAEITGLAPRRPVQSAKEAVQLASDYPFDPWAVFTAGQAAAKAGQHGIAMSYFESTLWLAMADPNIGRRAFAELQRLSREWRERRLVPVQIWADETVRADPAWLFRTIHLFRNLSHDSDPMVKTVFLPTSRRTFESGEGFPTLANISQRVHDSNQRIAPNGIVIIFTERKPPDLRGESWRLGQAEFLGRIMTVRLEPGELRSRVLAHELLHLYGGIHISPETKSIMNPSGGSYTLDPINSLIFKTLRNRRFHSTGIKNNVFPWIDIAQAADAYEQGVLLNLKYRKAGMIEARKDFSQSPYVAAQRAQKAQQLDEHLISITKFLAELRLTQGETLQAIETLRVTYQLQGPNTAAGRKTLARIQGLEARLLRQAQ